MKPLPDFIETVLRDVKRIVIKIGTRVIDDEKTQFNQRVMESLVQEIAELKSKGIEVLLVTSGAVGAGMRELEVPKRPVSIHLRQAYAAVGQGRLMHHYGELFREHDITTAQVLLTRADFDRRASYLNARETLQHLLTIGILPIINENDTVAIDELKFGDNDFLASLVAGKMDAGLLILLTRVDGVYRSFKKDNDLIEFIQGDFDEAFSSVHDKIDPLSMGGMRSKLEAGKAAGAKGVLVVIANGLRQGILGNILSGCAHATWIVPGGKRMAAWKYYLAFAKTPCGGKIMVDEGAVSAIRESGKSLLASGVCRVIGSFERKALVQIVDCRNNEFARGLVNYTSEELQRIQGFSSREIRRILDRKADEVVHRNNLVLV